MDKIQFEKEIAERLAKANFSENWNDRSETQHAADIHNERFRAAEVVRILEEYDTLLPFHSMEECRHERIRGRSLNDPGYCADCGEEF